jgi:hypothetical protein
MQLKPQRAVGNISKVGNRFDRAALATVGDQEEGSPGRGQEIGPVGADGERKRVCFWGRKRSVLGPRRKRLGGGRPSKRR